MDKQYHVKTLRWSYFGLYWVFHKNKKNARLGLDTSYKDGLRTKFEEKPSKGQNKTISMFLNYSACPFHSATESRICSNFMKFDQNCNF